MGPPPAKRRKKVVVLSSEDEEDEPAEHGRTNEFSARRTSLQDQATQYQKIQVLPTRLRSTTKPVTKAPPIAPVQSTNQPLPKKLAARHSESRKDPRPSSIDTYFSAASNVHAVKSASSQNPKVVAAIEEEDFIEDDSFDEELQKLPLSHRALNQAPTQAQSQPTILKQERSSKSLLSGSQVFRKLGDGIERSKKKDDAVKLSEDDTRPWAERYGPLSLEELAVHKKKVADVRDWLYNVFRGRSKKKVLILKGASGIGKTATVSTLSQAMDFDLIEWANPWVSDYTSDNYVSTTAQFEEFLGRSGKFSSLDITNSGEPTPSIENIVPEKRQKVILVEEFPNTFMTSTSALQSFRSSILQYLATSTPKDAMIPLVIILTESQMTSTSFLADTVTAHRLLSPSILNHPFTDTIEFNLIAPTFITKALNLVLQKEARNSGRRRIPGPSVLKRLSESGDVRSAIGSLEFLCLKGQDGDNWSGRVAAKGKKGAKTANTITGMEEESLELVTRREVSLGLFHAVGKVVYNKREGHSDMKATQDPPIQPPTHLPQHARLKAPDVAVDALMDETGTDTTTFVASLHENYVLSCCGDRFLDTLNSCVEALSDSDVLTSGVGRGGRFRAGGGNGTFGGTGADAIRQDEIAWHVAVRGLLFGLPCPVKRGGLPPASASASWAGKVRGRENAFKMFYPTSLRLGKRMLEIEEGVERCVEKIRNTSQSGLGVSRAVGSSMKEDDVTSWGRRTILPADSDSEDTAVNTPGACGIPSKDDLLRDVLPYLSIISSYRPNPLLPLEDLHAITKISASNNVMPTAEESPDDLDVTEQSTGPPSSKPRRDGSTASRNGMAGKEEERDPSAALAVEQAVGKLYLSDDDIED